MSEQYLGGFIVATPTEPTATSAPGIWTVNQAATYRKQGLWPTTSGAPTIGTATAGNATASVTFSAPSDVGSAPITNYTVTSTPSSITGTGASSPVTVSGLANGTAYTFKVKAFNGAGTSAESAASNSVTPAAPPAWVLAYYTTGSNNVGGGSLYLDSSQVLTPLGQLGSSNFSLMTVSAAGSISAQKTWVGSLNSSSRYRAYYDTTNNFLYIPSGGATTGVTKINPSASTAQWSNYLSISQESSSASYDTTVDSSQNVYVVGVLRTNPSCCTFQYRNYLSKYNSSGTRQWTAQRARDVSSNYNVFYGVVLDGSSQPVAVGSYNSTAGLAALIMKFDTSGTVVWQNQLTTNGPVFRSIAKDSSNNYYVGGSTNNDGLVAKYNDSGTLQWQRKLTVSGRQYEIWKTRCDSSGNSYHFGQINDSSSGSTYLLKYNSSGTLQWQRVISPTSGFYLNSNLADFILDTTDSAIIINYGASNVTSTGNGYVKLVLKYPMDGSKTGSYTVGTATFSISAGSGSEDAATTTSGTANNLSDALSLSDSSLTLPTFSTVSYSSALTNL